MGHPRDPKSGDIPDLDLGPAGPKRVAPEAQGARAAPAGPAAPPPPAGAALDLFGGGFDEDHFGGGSLDTAAARQPSSGVYDGGGFDLGDDEDAAKLNLELSSYRPPAPEGSVAPGPVAPGAAGVTAPPPGPHSLAPALPDVDPGAVSLVARYGPAPGAFYLAPLYAFRVLSRRRELRAELARLDAETRAQERTLEELHAALASAARPAIEGDARFSAALAPIRQLEGIAGERGAVLRQANAQFEQQNAQLEEQLRAVQEQIAPLEAAKQRAAAAVADAEALVGRTVAKQKRFLIEARSVKMSVLPPGSPPNTPLPPEAAERIRAFEAQAAAVQPELDQHRHALAAAQAELQRVRDQIGALGQHARRIQDQQRALARRFQGQLSAASAGLDEAQRELTSALANLGRALIAQKEALPLDPATLTAIQSGEGNLKRLAEACALHLAALDAYDREAVKKGYLVAGAAVGAVLLLIVLLALL